MFSVTMTSLPELEVFEMDGGLALVYKDDEHESCFYPAWENTTSDEREFVSSAFTTLTEVVGAEVALDLAEDAMCLAEDAEDWAYRMLEAAID